MEKNRRDEDQRRDIHRQHKQERQIEKASEKQETREERLPNPDEKNPMDFGAGSDGGSGRSGAGD